MRRFPLIFVMVMALSAASAADETVRPACNAERRGQLWPEQANTDESLARKAAQCGELWMCTKGVWRHRWEKLGVHISQLGRNARETAPGCEQFTGGSATKPASSARESAVE